MSGKDEEADPRESLTWLEPETLTFRWSGGSGPIHVTIGEECTVLRAHAVWAFPRSAPDGFVQLYASGPGGRGEPVGMIEDPQRLKAADRAALAECLRRSHVVPRVTRIVSLEEHRHLVHWVVETDRGPTSFDMDQVYDNVKPLPNGDVVLIDVVKNRYEVDPRALDSASRALLARFS